MMTAEAQPQSDRDVLRQHIERISARWCDLPEYVVMEFRMLRPGRTPNVARFDVLDPPFLDEAIDHVLAMNRAGLNAYAVVNPVRSEMCSPGKNATDEAIPAAFFNFIDCDDEAATNNVKEFAGPKQAFSVLTGTVPFSRPHVYWELEKPCRDMRAWRAQQIAMAARFRSDGVVINPSRIMRLAGTITYPDDRKQALGYVSETVQYRERVKGPPVPFDRLRALFPDGEPPAPGSSEGGAFMLDTGPQALDRAMASAKIDAGEDWHNNVVRLVASYVARGLTDGEIHAITDSFTQDGWTVEQTRAEVRAAIDGARRKGYAPPEYAESDSVQTPSQLEGIDTGEPDSDSPSRLEWINDLEPALGSEYIVKGMMDRGAMSVVYGPSNSGKTFFALDLAFHIAISAPWRGLRVHGGGVLYLAAEGGRGVINRAVALRAETGVCDTPLAIRRAGLDLLKSTADLQEIVDLAAEVNAREPLCCIVIDTLSRVIAGGDENSAQDMTAFIKNVDRIREITGAHIMIVHHTGKDTARGARGHSSLRAATDTEVEVQNEDGSRAAMVTKQRDHQGGEVFAFSLKSVHLGVDQDGDDVSSCVLEAEDAEEFTARKSLTKGLGGNQKIIADTFDQMLAEGMGKPNPGGVGMPSPGRFWTVETAEMMRIARGKMTGKNPWDSAKKAFEALRADRGLFCTGENVCWRVDREKN